MNDTTDLPVFSVIRFYESLPESVAHLTGLKSHVAGLFLRFKSLGLRHMGNNLLYHSLSHLWLRILRKRGNHRMVFNLCHINVCDISTESQKSGTGRKSIGITAVFVS